MHAVIHLGVGLYEMFPVDLDMSVCSAIVEFLLSKSYCWDFMSVVSMSCLEGMSFVRDAAGQQKWGNKCDSNTSPLIPETVLLYWFFNMKLRTL